MLYADNHVRCKCYTCEKNRRLLSRIEDQMPIGAALLIAALNVMSLVLGWGEDVRIPTALLAVWIIWVLAPRRN